ncbi:hypothetical protein ACFQ1L_25940 [Phytohabitans flavus]|uniref:hypothetical protein n=1 Tax=Phytohabitans flavus TaxID=1076124 RepID=UPI001564341C|nr:hypothetical protein [Phytohabitans flavus]
MDTVRSRAGPLAVLALVLVVTSGCVGPTLTAHGYRDRVVYTAGQLSSAIATTDLAGRLQLDHKAILALTNVVVSQAESDADDATTALFTRQPPTSDSLALYERVRQPFQDAVDALRAVRIAVRREDREALRAGLAGLAGPAQQVSEIQQAAG